MRETDGELWLVRLGFAGPGTDEEGADVVGGTVVSPVTEIGPVTCQPPPDSGDITCLTRLHCVSKVVMIRSRQLTLSGGTSAQSVSRFSTGKLSYLPTGFNSANFVKDIE